jgi:c-di-GMP-binding flagellar brake protein YcgR
MVTDSIARRDYRINVRGNDTVRLSINKAPCEIIDISSGGIGIKLTSGEDQVAAGEELACELQINGLARIIRGKVVHVTPQRPGYSLAGLQFIDIAGEIREKLLHFLQLCRKEKFRER